MPLASSANVERQVFVLRVAIKQLLIVQLALFVADKPALEQSLICATNSWPKRDLPRPHSASTANTWRDHRRDPPYAKRFESVSKKQLWPTNGSRGG